MSYTDRAWELPADFPEPPSNIGFNRQWIPVKTTAFEGWYCLPLELSAKQLTEVENRLEIEERRKGPDTETQDQQEVSVRLDVLKNYSFIQHLILDARIDGLEPAMWQDPTGLLMPSVELARAIYGECLGLVARARSLGNSLRPFSGLPNPEAAAN